MISAMTNPASPRCFICGSTRELYPTVWPARFAGNLTCDFCDARQGHVNRDAAAANAVPVKAAS